MRQDYERTAGSALLFRNNSTEFRDIHNGEEYARDASSDASRHRSASSRVSTPNSMQRSLTRGKSNTALERPRSVGQRAWMSHCSVPAPHSLSISPNSRPINGFRNDCRHCSASFAPRARSLSQSTKVPQSGSIATICPFGRVTRTLSLTAERGFCMGWSDRFGRRRTHLSAAADLAASWHKFDVWEVFRSRPGEGEKALTAVDAQTSAVGNSFAISYDVKPGPAGDVENFMPVSDVQGRPMCAPYMI